MRYVAVVCIFGDSLQACQNLVRFEIEGLWSEQIQRHRPEVRYRIVPDRLCHHFHRRVFEDGDAGICRAGKTAGVILWAPCGVKDHYTIIIVSKGFLQRIFQINVDFN